MANVDRLGRRRHLDQHRGLRSLFPTLPSDCQSRLMRVAMSATAWTRLEELMATSAAPTAPRAVGSLIEGWLAAWPETAAASTSRPLHAAVGSQEAAASSDWQDWQMRKELALLASVKPGPVADQHTMH